MMPVLATATDISFLQFKTYNASTVILFVSFFVLLISIILVIAYRSIARQKVLETNAIERQFFENCKRFSFDTHEVQVLKLAVSRMQGENSNDVFDVQNVYERAIHDDIESSIERGVDTKELEMLYGEIRKKLHFILLPDGVALTSTRSISSGHPISLIDIKCEARIIENLETCFVIKYADDFPVLIKPEQPLRFAFSRSNDGLYAADVRVIEHSGGKIKCRHTITLKRHQLRKDVRMRMSGKIKLFMRDSENNRISFEGKLIDISAGGFCFESSVTIPVKAIVNIDTCTLPVHVSGVKAVVIASSQREKDTGVVNKYHASYVDIPFDKKEKIVSYLFVKMRELQKK